MKLKRLFALLGAVIISTSLYACFDDDTEDSSSGGGTSQFVEKPVDGTDILFDEGMDFYNKAPSVIKISDSEKYIFYTVNDVAKGGKSSIAVRKAVKEDDEWSYGEKTAALAASESAFDKAGVSDPDVIGGRFVYDGDEYAYLMAYEGTDNLISKDHKIGFAVAKNPLGEWKKVENLVLSGENFDSFGLSQPSLINFDKKNKVVLFCSSDRGSYTVQTLREMDLADLNNPVIGVENVLAEKGIKDKNDYPTFNDADFAYDSVSGYLYVVRNQNPSASQGCKLITAVQVNKILFADLFTDDARWSIVKERVEWKDLRDPDDEESMGWSYVYSACISADAFGYVDNAAELDVVLTVTSYDEATFDYLYYQTMTEFTVKLV